MLEADGVLGGGNEKPLFVCGQDFAWGCLLGLDDFGLGGFDAGLTDVEVGSRPGKVCAGLSFELGGRELEVEEAVGFI